MTKQRATPQDLQRLLDYCPETGHFYWKECEDPDLFSTDYACDRHHQKVGRRADRKIVSRTLNVVRIKVFGTLLRAHRVAFMIMMGRDLKKDYEIDHINGNPYDNRWDNLREVTHAENNQNRSLPSNNTSGHMGVSFSRKKGKWYARINANGKRYVSPPFRTRDEAIRARRDAEVDLDYHPNHGRKKS